MSYPLLEAVRRSIVGNIDAELAAAGSSVVIGDKVRPEDTKGQEKFENNQLPTITYACLTSIPTLRTEVYTARVRLQVNYRAAAKDKTLWDIQAALAKSVRPEKLNAALAAQTDPVVWPELSIWFQKFKQDGEADDGYNAKNDIYQIRSVWLVNYVDLP